MIRRRSSSRCSRKLIAGIVSCGFGRDPSETLSGIGSLRQRRLFGAGFYTVFRTRFQGRTGGFRRQGQGGYRTLRRLGWRQNLPFILRIQLRNLRRDLGLEFVRGALDLIEHLAHLARDLRQLLGPKNEQRQEKQKYRLRKAHATHHTAPARWRQRGPATSQPPLAPNVFRTKYREKVPNPRAPTTHPKRE